MGITEELLNSGLGWATTIVLAGVVVFLFKHIVALYKEKESLQEARLNDMKGINEKYTEVVGKNSQTLELLSAKLSAGKEG